MNKPTLPPQYDPAQIEKKTYQRWLDSGAFTGNNASDKDPYVIVIPPPNVTAVLHMGHGLNNTLQDVMIRFERMRGRESVWLPGTDHAGIATQNVVERQIAKGGKTRHDLGREAFVEKVWEHVNQTGSTILDQLKAIGASCDWSRTNFTLDDHYSFAVRKVFVTLHEEGLIYRGLRIIHWCPRCHTALSDEEAEFHDREGRLFYIRYPVEGSDKTVTVATTRPETMFGDVCLVYHPEDERFQGLEGSKVQIPLTDVTIPIFTSTHVERDFGTGMLKVTPAHDANDFDIANQLGGFDRPVILDAEANLADVDRVPKNLRGLARDDAQKKIRQMLEEEGHLERIEKHDHAVRRCYRCDTLVEPRLSDQWFVKMKPLAEPALKAYYDGEVRFIPERWGKTYENWMTNIRDWNISRQLWWGHRIPAWYCQNDDCEKITVSMDTPKQCSCGGELIQDEDVLDTWFSSWLWPFATFGWPEKTQDLKRFYPGHTLVTAPEIIFFWVARMIMAGYHFMGDKPFDTVYLNGTVRDTKHQKMSKSKGNGIDPLDVVERFGADALRFTCVSDAATGNDIILDPSDLDTSFAVGRNFANKLWNVGRFILTNLEGPVLSRNELASAKLALADRWLLSKTQNAITQVTNHLDNFRLNEAASAAYQFVWNEIADWYVEQAKPRLYDKAPGGDAARGCLLLAFEEALKLLHPMMPFISEELWSHLPPHEDRSVLLATSPWPTASEELIDREVERRFLRVQELITAVRTIRAEYNVPPGASVKANVEPASKDIETIFSEEQNTITWLAKVETLSFGSAEGVVGGNAVLPDGSAVFVPLEGAIDVASECARLKKELDRLEGQLKQVRAKLGNEKFTGRAPEDVVLREREKEQAWSEQCTTLGDKLRALGC
ncbi:MAG: valine--tRNA ligase [Gemmatimonadota bacterium]|nr:valine--tRNA ligase [Gemmatimonadota bacterium]